jgi:hypothetical protein
MDQPLANDFKRRVLISVSKADKLENDSEDQGNVSLYGRGPL